MTVTIGPILPAFAVNPSPWVGPVFPPLAVLGEQRCPLCGAPLVNGTPISVSKQGLAHAYCGGET